MKERLRVTALLVAAMAAGYVGGLMSNSNGLAVAQDGTPSTSDVLRAKKFQLVDDEGKVCGALTAFKNGPALVLYDSDSRTRGSFGLFDGEPAFVLVDSSGRSRGSFSLNKGEPRLAVADSTGQSRAVLEMIESNPLFGLKDASGKTRGQFRMHNGECKLELWDGYGKRRQSLGLLDNEPFILLADSAEKTRGVFCIADDEAHIGLLAANGGVRWSAMPTSKGPAVSRPVSSSVELAVTDIKWKGHRITGVATNESSQRLRYAKVEFNLYDDQGAHVDNVFAITRDLDAGGKWKFEMGVTASSATRYRLVRAYGDP